MGTVEQNHPAVSVAVNINELVDTTLAKLPNKDVPKVRHSIYKVPKHVRDNANRKHYEPQLISIGPYHRGNNKEHLRAMEERKWQYLRRFVDTCRPPGTLKQCISMLKANEEKARACYFESSKLNSAEFIEMLLLDGCFLVRFFLDLDKSDDDPNFDAAWSLPLLHTDLLMLENQIPYFVLREIYQIYRPHSNKQLPNIILQSFEKHGIKSSTTKPDKLHERNFDHLLHLYYDHFTAPPSPQFTYTNKNKGNKEQDSRPPPPKTVPCAKELNLHGVSLEPRKTTDHKGNIFNVTFHAGVLQIPQLRIEPLTCTVFLNLVAFEQSKRGAATYFSNYVMLLDNLVNTVEDVHILNESRILDNMLPSEEDAARFFNQLSACLYIKDDDNYLERVHGPLHEFCDNSWNKYKAMFRRNYLNSPWSIFGFYLSLLFALITVFTTIINILDKFTHVIKK